MTRETAAAEFDLPGERRGRIVCIELCRGAVAEPGEDVNAAGMAHQHQGVVMTRILKQQSAQLCLCPSKNPLGVAALEEDLALIQTIVGENSRRISTLARVLQTPYDSPMHSFPSRRHFLGSIRSGTHCAAIPLSKSSAKKTSREPRWRNLTDCTSVLSAIQIRNDPGFQKLLSEREPETVYK